MRALSLSFFVQFQVWKHTRISPALSRLAQASHGSVAMRCDDRANFHPASFIRPRFWFSIAILFRCLQPFYYSTVSLFIFFFSSFFSSAARLLFACSLFSICFYCSKNAASVSFDPTMHRFSRVVTFSQAILHLHHFHDHQSPVRVTCERAVFYSRVASMKEYCAWNHETEGIYEIPKTGDECFGNKRI